MSNTLAHPTTLKSEVKHLQNQTCCRGMSRHHKPPVHCHWSSSRDGRNQEGSLRPSWLSRCRSWTKAGRWERFGTGCYEIRTENKDSCSMTLWTDKTSCCFSADVNVADRQPTQPQRDNDVVSRATKAVRSFVLNRSFLPLQAPNMQRLLCMCRMNRNHSLKGIENVESNILSPELHLHNQCDSPANQQLGHYEEAPT